jgi:protein-S-isoprenylcysteine O-methyltransferase Ste14
MTETSATTKGSFWAVAIVYALITFEFFYMVSPFAVYLYSVYGPGLQLTQTVPGLSWLAGFFLPHLVRDTGVLLLDLHEAAGALLFLGGLLVFVVGAAQVYGAKLLRRGAVTGGLYRWLRHPQYTGLIVSGIGMLLLWPRFLVLVMFVTMLFAYTLLASAEERECLDRFGDDYADYLRRTHRFFPVTLPWLDWLPSLPSSRWPRLGALVVLYAVSVGMAVGLATVTQMLVVRSLQTVETESTVFLSLVPVEPTAMAGAIQTVMADVQVQERLATAREPAGARFIGYVLPTDLFISEIPMHSAASPTGHGYHLASNARSKRLKIVITRADGTEGVASEHLLRHARHLTPVVEAWLDESGRTVAEVLEPAEQQYGGLPMPVF